MVGTSRSVRKDHTPDFNRLYGRWMINGGRKLSWRLIVICTTSIVKSSNDNNWYSSVFLFVVNICKSVFLRIVIGSLLVLRLLNRYSNYRYRKHLILKYSLERNEMLTWILISNKIVREILTANIYYKLLKKFIKIYNLRRQCDLKSTQYYF